MPVRQGAAGPAPADHFGFGKGTARLRDHDTSLGAARPGALEGRPVGTRQAAAPAGPRSKNCQSRERHGGTVYLPADHQHHALSPCQAASRVRYGITVINTVSASP